MEVIITALNFGGSIPPKLNDKLKYSKKASFGIMLINDVIKTIDVAKEDYDINLTALDVENINSEFGAYKDIGRKHGVSAEVVYFIKANFR